MVDMGNGFCCAENTCTDLYMCTTRCTFRFCTDASGFFWWLCYESSVTTRIPVHAWLQMCQRAGEVGTQGCVSADVMQPCICCCHATSTVCSAVFCSSGISPLVVTLVTGRKTVSFLREATELAPNRQHDCAGIWPPCGLSSLLFWLMQVSSGPAVHLCWHVDSWFVTWLEACLHSWQ